MEINILEIIGVAVGIAVLSFVFKPNPIQRLTESLYVGSAAGYLLVVNFNSVYKTAIVPLPSDLSLIIPLILGILLFTRLSKKYSWLSNYPLSFLAALGIGISVRTIVETDIIKQITSTAVPLIVPNNALASFSNIVILVSTVTVISYFLYSRRPTKILSASSKMGTYFMMIAFGGTIANSLLSRTSKTIGFLQQLILVPSGLYMVPIMIIIIFISVFPEKIGLKRK